MESNRPLWAAVGNGQQSGHFTVYVNARVIDPASNTDFIGYVLTQEGRTIEWGQMAPGDTRSPCAAAEVVDCGGHILMPGIVDIHVHLREPGGEHKETVETGSKSAAAGGITTVVCQPNTSPRIDSVLVAKYLKMRALESAFVNVEFYGAVTKTDGTLCDMASLKDAGALGFTDDGSPIMNSMHMKNAFEWGKNLGVVIAQHAEDSNLSRGGCINEGKISRELGLRGMPDISESILVNRDIQLLREVPGAHYHVLHVSTKKSLDAISAAKREGLHVTCEVTPHHFLLNEDAIITHGGMAKMNPPLRTEEDRLSMLEGMKDGIIDCIATDHAPHTDQEKIQPLPCCAFGIVGLETLLPLSLELYHSGAMGLIDVLSMLTYKPADIVKIKRGRISKGMAADFVIFDLNREWTVDVSKFSSKSKNSPFHNRKVKGMVLRTVVSGKTVYLAS